MAKGFSEEQEEIKAFYAQIGGVPCQRFGGGLVFFNHVGFRHLVMKRGWPRPINEQRRRFALLRHAPNIISSPAAIFASRKKGRANFWMFQEERDGVVVKVIVRQLPSGKKHFYIVFSSKKKPPAN